MEFLWQFFRRIPILPVLLVCPVFLSAQSPKPSIGVLPFSSSETSFIHNAAEVINQKVTDALVNSNRFIVVERSKMDALAREKDYQMGYDFANSANMVAQGNAIGAAYLLTGHVNTVTFEENRYEDSETHKVTINYGCKVSATIKVINVETGRVEVTETLTPSAGTGLLSYFVGSSSKEAAWENASTGMYNSMLRLIAKEFPLEFPIIQVEEEKKGKAKVVLIAGGSRYGLSRGMDLDVFEITEIDVGGQRMEREKEVARISVLNVEGEDLATAKVTRDGDVLKQKIETGARLICRTQ